MSTRPTGRFYVLKAHAANPWEMCLMEFIAMSPVKTRPKPKTKAKLAAAAPRRDDGQPRFVGVDLHKEVATFHAVSHDGASLHSGEFLVNPDAIREFATAHLLPTDSLAVEATSNTWAFVRLVRPHVAKIVVSNPLKTKAIAEANIKTDKVDALVLAQLLRCDYLPSVWVPTSTVEDSRALAARRSALVNQHTAIRNRIHAVLARRLVKAPAGGLFTDKGLAWLKEVKLDPLDRALIDADLALDALGQQSLTIDLMIVNESHDDHDIQLLMTMPGVDYTIAHALKATIADVSRFADPDKLASYLGLVPSVKQSATKCYHGPITKAGSSQARWLLVQGAVRWPASGTAGSLLPQARAAEEPQRGGCGHSQEDGDDRVAYAHEQRTIPICRAAINGDQAGRAASAGDRGQAEDRPAEGVEAGPQGGRREVAHGSLARRGLQP